MKKSYLAVPLMALAVIPMLTGCVERTVYVQRPPDVVVGDAPPAPPQEVVVAAPSPAYVWVPGYWSRSGRWVWVGGRWAMPPHPHGAWVSGRWARGHHGYVWVRGYWR